MWSSDELTRAAVLVGTVLISLAITQLMRTLARMLMIGRGLADIPSAPGGNILIGHVLPLLKGTPWDIMAAWVQQSPPLVRACALLPAVYHTSEKLVQPCVLSPCHQSPMQACVLLAQEAEHAPASACMLVPAPLAHPSGCPACSSHVYCRQSNDDS